MFLLALIGLVVLSGILVTVFSILIDGDLDFFKDNQESDNFRGLL